ncbi:capsular biosynthesis protein [Pseudodesulfovibrio cashew]|uniref:Capsular biosynthesis protein n=1 Tax=Pseudodesulfovibrio cashew TaxID=2678688 RepID=A0A6I6JA72_9BACT|nr:capsular biosynthesis protein [Pseudodesulfovibrio cashew]QGY39575.1 capsular biosynthesis protein [Pseudodesulfovibrio cashew]
MILITSGAYVGHEIAAELGRLPTAFLPVGNRRLFAVQIELLKESGEEIVLSLPEDYALPEHDQAFLDRLGVRVLRVQPTVSLAESLQYCLSQLLPLDGPFRILHGDTLILDIPFGEDDVFSKGMTDAYYSWAEFREDAGGIRFIEGLPNGGFNREVLSGYFSFSSPYALLRALSGSRGNFIDALNRYAASHRLHPLETGKWFDFGHLQTYYRSKAMLTTERAFNSLMITSRTVTKSGRNPAKIEAEAGWFGAVPPALRLYLPAMLESAKGEGAFYQLEYLYLSSLSELFVFGDLPPFLWENIFASCDEFLTQARAAKPGAGDAAATDGLYLDKTLERLERFSRENGVDLDREWRINGRPVPGLSRMAELAASAIPPVTDKDLGVMHGDFHFANILYDFRHGIIKALDPRGLTADGRFCVHGDLRYDVAKLHHSVVGRYDFIKADRFACRDHGGHALSLTLPGSERLDRVEALFKERTFGGYTLEGASSQAVCVLLFLSMLPLHADRPGHQLALLANGLRLFADMDALHVAAPPKGVAPLAVGRDPLSGFVR